MSEFDVKAILPKMKDYISEHKSKTSAFGIMQHLQTHGIQISVRRVVSIIEESPELIKLLKEVA